MAKRHSDAIAIQLGACNPSGIALSIVAACKEIRDEPAHQGTRSITGDPAVRLMVHQLAFICGLPDAWNPADYIMATDVCNAAAIAKAEGGGS